MPRGGHRGTGLLHQHMIVKQLDGIALHQIGGDFGSGGSADHLLEFGDSLPIATIVEKPTRLACLVVIGRIGARFVHVARDACAQGLDVVFEQIADDHHTVTLVGVDARSTQQRMQHQRFLRRRITTSTDAISAPSGASGNCAITSWSEGASLSRASSSQKKCG